MKISLKEKTAVFPMPVLMIGTYDKNGTIDVMNAAWGGICDYDKIAINLDEEHKTVKNLRETKAFTVALATEETMIQSDYFGIVSGNDVPDKFAISGFHATKSKVVNAPVIEEYPLTMECEVIELQEQPYGLRLLGRIVNVIAEESILNSDGDVDITKLNAIMYDTFTMGYYKTGKRVGNVFEDGNKVKNN